MRAMAEQDKAFEPEVAFLIKWNPRSTPVERIAAHKVMAADTLWCPPEKASACVCWKSRCGCARNLRRLWHLAIVRVMRGEERARDLEGVHGGWGPTIQGAVDENLCDFLAGNPVVHRSAQMNLELRRPVQCC